MLKVWLRSRRSDAGKAGRALGRDDFGILVNQNAAIYKPNGDPLAILVKGAISPELSAIARKALIPAAGMTTNRGIAAAGERGLRRRKDGSISRTAQASGVRSGIIGYFDRYPRIPYCRQTSYNENHLDKFDAVRPVLSVMADVFRDHIRDRYDAQMGVCRETHPAWVIKGTPFSTVTVNKNFRTMMHRDAGDLSEGFGVMACLRAGSYGGSYFCFPQYGVAVDMEDGDVLLGSVHDEWHGNTPFEDPGEDYERWTLVAYYREKMIDCGSPEEELERAKSLKEL